MEHPHSVNEDPMLGTFINGLLGIFNNGETTNDIPNPSIDQNPSNVTRQPSVSVMADSMKDLSLSQMLQDFDDSSCFEEQPIPDPSTSPDYETMATFPNCQIRITQQPEFHSYKFR